MSVRLCTALAGLLLAVAARAQPVVRPVLTQGVVVETRLVRDLNRYRYEGLVTFGAARGAWQVSGDGQFSSDAFEIFGGRLTFRDEVEARLRVLRTLSPRLALGVETRTMAFSQSRVLGHETVAVAALRPADYLTGEIEAGLALDQRPGASVAGGVSALRTDAGPGGSARVAFRPPPGEYALDVRAHAGWAALSPRQTGEVGFEAGVERQIEATRLALRAHGSRVRRDAYQAASFLNRTDGLLAETVEATTSDTLLASLSLDMPIGRVVRFTSQLDVGANARRVRTLQAREGTLFFDTNFSREAVAYEGALLVERPGLLARLAVRTGAEAEQRVLVNRDALPPAQAAQKGELLRQADYDRGLLTTILTLRGSRGRFSAFAEAATSILRHDTPGVNPDDRDEAQQTVSVGLQWRLRPSLTLDGTGFGSFYHTVYLKRQRSGENNRQRSLRLRPTATWTPAPLTRVVLSSEVRATYTLADVVLPGRTGDDQAARELRYEMEMDHAFSNPLRVRARATFSDLRLGRLLRGRFAEIPFDTVRTYTLDLRAQLVRRATVEVGIRLFLRRDSERSITVRYPRTDADGSALVDADGQPIQGAITRPGRSWRRQVGPVVRVSWPLGGLSAVELEGWYALQRLSHTLFGTLPESAAPAIRCAARDGHRDVFPNLSLTVRWAIR